MTINQIIAFCLVAVLIGFLVVLAIMAKHAKMMSRADLTSSAITLSEQSTL